LTIREASNSMSWVQQIVNRDLASLKTQLHGGNVWDKFDESIIKSGKVIDFSSNISPLGPSRKVREVIKNSFWKLGFYPQTDAKKLRKTIARQYKDLSFRNVIVGNGSSELIYLFADVFVQKRTLALIPIPTFSEYEAAIRRAGGKVKDIRPKKDLRINIEGILNLISKDRIVILCNPNNPTGTLVDPEDLRTIITIAARRKALIFIDEAFMDFVEDQKKHSLASEVQEHPNLLVLRSLTKFHSLAGLRIGYGLASEEIIEALHRAKVPWTVNCLAQAAAETALRDDEHAKSVRESVARERAFMLNQLKAIPGLGVNGSETDFLLIDTRGIGLTGKEISKRALEEEMMIRDCSSFKGLDEFHVRIAIRTRKQNLALLRFLGRLSRRGN